MIERVGDFFARRSRQVTFSDLDRRVATSCFVVTTAVPIKGIFRS
jgi:hypothetical protein